MKYLYIFLLFGCGSVQASEPVINWEAKYSVLKITHEKIEIDYSNLKADFDELITKTTELSTYTQECITLAESLNKALKVCHGTR